MLLFERLDCTALTDVQFEQLVKIENCCAAEPFSPEILRDCIKNMDNFLCRDGDGIVGFITVNPQSKRLGGSVYIVNINVLPEYRRKGVATGLIRTACEYYCELSEEKLVSLDVTRTNSAKRLYERIGFSVCDEESMNGDTDVMMSLRLSALRMYFAQND